MRAVTLDDVTRDLNVEKKAGMQSFGRRTFQGEEQGLAS